MILEAIPEIIPRLVFEILLVYAAVINFAAFAAYGVDKRRAKKDLWRIPEKRSFCWLSLAAAPEHFLACEPSVIRPEKRNLPWEYR